jgi:fucose permease
MVFNEFGEVNYLAVVVAALAFFAWGAIWYAPPVMGKTWRKAVSLSQEQLRPNPMVFIGTYIAYFLMALALAVLARAADASTFSEGLVLGLIVGIGIAAAGIWVGGMYEQRMRLAWLNMGNAVIGLIIMAVIVTVWE